MKNPSRSWLFTLISVGSVALAVILLILVLRPRWGAGPMPAGEAATPPTATFDSPIVTPAPPPTLAPTPTDAPTPTVAPFPTWPPTPVVTRVPVARPPFIPLPEGEAQPYLILTHDTRSLRVIDSATQEERTLFDVFATAGLYVVDRTVGEWEWASPAPDGRQLALVLTNVEPRAEAFAYHQGAVEFGIYLYDMATGSLELLIKDGVKPVWSPDGGRIAYRDRKTQSMWIVDIHSRERFEAFSVGYPETENQADWFTWSPRGDEIAVVKNWSDFANAGGIWIVEATPNGKQRQIMPMEMNAHSLEWAPIDGNLLFRSSMGKRFTPNTVTNVWLVNTEDGKSTQLTKDKYASGFPHWSPDGKWIAVALADLLEGDARHYDIWLLAMNGEILLRLNDDLISDMDPKWSLDGRSILFTKKEQGIFELDINTGFIQNRSKYTNDFILVMIARDH